MDFHPQKCSVLRVTRATSNLIPSEYILKGIKLSIDKTTKYLGVDLDSELSWRHHYDRVTKKANNMLGFLRRNLRNTSQQTKTNAYIALVRSSVEYCCTVWSPHYGTHKYQLEMVQRRAARFITNRFHNTSSVDSMLEELNCETLETRRTKHQLTMLYRIVNKLVDIDANKYLTPRRKMPRHPHGSGFLPVTHTSDIFKYSFFPRSIPLWNDLPASVAEAPSLASFKSGLSSLTF
jgi:hypothetical protein